ncbi:MAG: hypothetical protein EB829_04230 [Nitrosopumilus sp. H8]|nr:MAG: hypothetical protein EB829_04230 [Nitrosopumilus sp. H8]
MESSSLSITLMARLISRSAKRHLAPSFTIWDFSEDVRSAKSLDVSFILPICPGGAMSPPVAFLLSTML